MTGHASWTVWGLEASVAVTDPALTTPAEKLVRAVVSSVDDACSRFRTDSELVRIQPRLASGVTVSQLLALLVESSLDAARWTSDDVDPTLGGDMEALGYDRDFAEVMVTSTGVAVQEAWLSVREPGWSRVRLDKQTLTVPEDLQLDLGATAKAVAADRAAALVAEKLGCGALISLGGDSATAGTAPDGGWQVLVQDVPADPSQQVILPAGSAVATSSTQKRRWRHGGKTVHHILDPRFGFPAEPVWKSVTVVAPTCLLANAYSTAGVIRGFGAVRWCERESIDARFVDQKGRAVTTGAWPRDGRQGNMVLPEGQSNG